MKTYPNHKFSAMFPSMRKEEYSSLLQSIRENGLREPIILFQDAIIDGRHRMKACIEAAVTPRFTHFGGTEYEARMYAFDVNFHRRNLSVQQKACAAAELNQMLKLSPVERQLLTEKVKNGELKHSKNQVERRTIAKCAEKFGISQMTASTANSLLLHAKHLFEKVKSGHMRLQAAYREYRGYTSSPRKEKTIFKNTKINMTNSVGIKIPDSCAAPYEVFQFIDVMIQNGWKLEMKVKDRVNSEGETKAMYYVNWYGNGYTSLLTSWTGCKGEIDFRRAVVTAAHDRLGNLKLAA